jgi:1-deoxy-D-xylulose-5-phosphate synthase
MVHPCTTVAEELDASLINMRFIKPLDAQAITIAAGEHDLVVTVEENALAGGAGSAVNEYLAGIGLKPNLLNIGLADDFIEHATREECLSQAGLDSDGILRQIRSFMDKFGLSSLGSASVEEGQGRQANA